MSRSAILLDNLLVPPLSTVPTIQPSQPSHSKIAKSQSVMITSSTLHCRGKNGRSKKIDQTNQDMIHFVPNMYVSGKISALRPGTQSVMIFGTAKKSENYPKQRDFRICGFLHLFAGFCVVFCGVLRVFSLVVWCAANIMQSKIEDQRSI